MSNPYDVETKEAADAAFDPKSKSKEHVYAPGDKPKSKKPVEPTPPKADDAQSLAQKEDDVGKGFNPEGAEPKTRATMKTDRARGLLGAINANLKSKRTLLFGGAGAAFMVLIIMFILAAFLKIPNLTQNITRYEFERMSRQFSESAKRSTNESLALEAVDDKTYTGLRATYENAKGNVKKTWSKLDKYRPEKTIANLKSPSGANMKLNYTLPDALGRQRLASVTLNIGGEPQLFEIAQAGAVTRHVPVLSKMIKFKNNVTFARNFQPTLSSALDAENVAPIIRGSIAKRIRQQLGISLVAWVLAKFKGKTGTAARTVETTERITATDESPNRAVVNTVTDTLKDTVKDIEVAEEQGLKSPAEVTEAMNNQGIFKRVTVAVKNGLKSSALNEVLGIVNPTLGVAMPMCIVYDGSLEKAGSTIDNQSAQATAIYYYLASAGDQQNAGDKPGGDPNEQTERTAAIGATNQSLGDTSKSNAQIRAGGGTVDTATSDSAEASAGGNFTLLNATLGQLKVPGANAVADTINAVGDTVCPVLTNTTFSVTLGIFNIATGIASLGTGPAAEKAGAEAATAVVTAQARSVAENLVTKYIGKRAGRATGLLYDTGKGTVKSAVKVAAMTVIAKLIVLNKSGQMFSGAADSTTLANQADQGAKIHANELERTQLFGRPLTMNEVCQSDQEDRRQLGVITSSRSAYDRYLNPHYADSLMARSAVTFSTSLSGSASTTLMTLGDSLFLPFTSFGSLLSLFTGKSSAAPNCNADSNNYGDVEFGFSQAEEDRIDGNDSYRPLQNQEILDQSGQEALIAAKYAHCFGYTYNPDGNGSFDPTDTNGNLTLADGPGQEASLGTLLSSGKDTIRDSHGNVQDSGLCAPSALGYQNDLVFRWRLASQYDTTYDQLTSMQTVTNTKP